MQRNVKIVSDISDKIKVIGAELKGKYKINETTYFADAKPIAMKKIREYAEKNGFELVVLTYELESRRRYFAKADLYAFNLSKLIAMRKEEGNHYEQRRN